METSLLFYILFFPLVGFLINGLVTFFYKDLESCTQKRLGWSAEVFFLKTRFFASIVGVGVVFLSFAVGLLCFFKLFGLSPEKRELTQILFTWIESGSLKLDFAFQFDALSSLMVLVVTGVGALIHLYSVGYMHEDKGYTRYFAYLNLFIFAMLMLVLGNSLLILFIGWEGVGLSSYLLIGFWYTDPEKAKAGKKAFITNRVGDFGFMLGALFLFAIWGTLEFNDINRLAREGGTSALYLNIAGILLFIGACGKSAQIPLYVWLPDAMAGPTPVSALIHAATMVTAGVYMVARLGHLYFAATTALATVAIVGALTAIFAATIGLVQNDIKKVLAYSTISQLGYMFLACGVGAPILAIFHLITHAFFKACLFLGAGSVLHGMGGEQDIRKMGGLKAKMPITFWTFLLATLAIAGFPPLSGFFSKDEILLYAYGSERGCPWLWGLGAVAALCTSFYMFRLVYLTFLGESRASHEVYHHAHESPFTMTVVLRILAVLSVVGGVIAIPHIFHIMPNFLEKWLGPTIPTAHLTHEGALFSWTFVAVSVAIAVAGLLLAYFLYGRKTDLPEKLSTKLAPAYRLLLNKYYVDEMYEKVVYHPLDQVSEKVLFEIVDKRGIDGCVNGSGRLCRFISRSSLKLQPGDMQYYLLYIVFGLLAFTTVIFFNLVK